MCAVLHNPTCAEFQDQLPDLIASGVNLAVHPHLLACPRCRTLLNELEAIAESARQLLSPVEPPDKLWEQIESAIRLDSQHAPSTPKPLPDSTHHS